MKRFTLLLIISNLLFVQHLFAAKSIWDGRSSDTSWYNDTSSEYHINSAAQFKGFADLVSYNYCSFEGKTIYLECDVDLDNHPWSPIGLHSGKPFYGIFDGLNHSITNLIPSANTANITNSYYVNTWATNSEVYGTSITENELKSGNPLPGFDTTTWVFNENEYPSLISLKSLIPQPTYTVTYYVDGLLYQVDEYKEGDAVVPPADPIKEGYTFDGWGYVPPVISGNSWIVYGSFSINSYVITYMIDDVVFLTETQEYNSYINPPKYYPIKQGYLFNWGEYPYNVPAHDVTIVGYYTEDFYECVDLGLPSGLLWATKNVGAANSESSGYYFSWGETYLKESYYWGTYEYCNGSANTLMKYCYSSDYGIVDNKLTLDEDDDAARVSWGSPWRLPTENEALELYNSCSWSLGSLNGVNGCYVTGPNGNSIFFPYAGIKQYQTTLKGGSEMYLLTSSLYHYDDIRMLGTGERNIAYRGKVPLEQGERTFLSNQQRACL